MVQYWHRLTSPIPRNSSPPPIPLPDAADAEVSITGWERRVRKRFNYAEPKLNTCALCTTPSRIYRIPSHRMMRKPAPDETCVVAGLPRRRHTTVTKRRRKSRSRLLAEDSEESDGAQADEEPLAWSGVGTTDLAKVDTRRRNAVVSTSRRSLIEDVEGRQHSMLV
jgi:hypothetical protein